MENVDKRPGRILLYPLLDHGDVQRMVLGSLMLDVAGSSVDGLRSTFRRTQHFLPPFDTGWIEGGNISGFLRTVRDWLV